MLFVQKVSKGDLGSARSTYLSNHPFLSVCVRLLPSFSVSRLIPSLFVRDGIHSVADYNSIWMGVVVVLVLVLVLVRFFTMG